MMSKQITMGELEELLRQVGFQLVQTNGYHQSWKHDASGTEILLPGGGQKQPASLADVVGVRTVLMHKGLLTHEQWEQRWEQVTSSPATEPLLPRFSVGEQVRLTDAPEVFIITSVHITATGATYDLEPLGRPATSKEVQGEGRLLPVNS